MQSLGLWLRAWSLGCVGSLGIQYSALRVSSLGLEAY